MAYINKILLSNPVPVDFVPSTAHYLDCLFLLFQWLPSSPVLPQPSLLCLLQVCVDGGEGCGDERAAASDESPLRLTLSASPTLSLVFWPKSNATGLVFVVPTQPHPASHLSPILTSPQSCTTLLFLAVCPWVTTPWKLPWSIKYWLVALEGKHTPTSCQHRHPINPPNLIISESVWASNKSLPI